MGTEASTVDAFEENRAGKDRVEQSHSSVESADSTAKTNSAAEPATKDANAAAGVEADDSAASLQTQIETLEDKLLRAKADYQNLQRRSSAEQAEAVRFANTDFARALLVVVDDLERALTAAKESDDVTALRDGVRLARDNFVKILGDHGVEPVESLHQPFDPTVHNAMMQQPTDEHPPGTVVQEMAKGYRYRDRVLRPAMVIVSKDLDTGDSDER